MDMSRRAGEEAQLKSGGVEMGDLKEPGPSGDTAELCFIIIRCQLYKTGPEESSPNLRALR